MKKLSFLFLALLAVTMFTACGNDDEPVNKQSVTMLINNRVIDGDNVVFSQGTAKVELDYTNMVISFTADYKDADGQSHTVNAPAMKMTSKGNTIYTFNNGATSSGVEVIGNLDLGTGMMWYTVNTGSTKVVSSTNLMYAYTTTTLTNIDNGNHGSHQMSGYLFAPDARGENCKLRIYNLTSNLNNVVDAPEVNYEGLTMTATTEGYKVTATSVESNVRGFYTLTDVDFTLDGQAQIINGTFKCNGLKFTITGSMFNSVN